MRKVVLAASCGALLVCLSGCDMLGGGDGYKLPEPRVTVDDPPTDSAKVSATKSAAKPAAAKDATPKTEVPIYGDSELLRRTLAINKMRTLADALNNFKQQQGCYPNQCADQGQLSWRVVLLPYLGKQELLFKFRPNEPWNSGHNQTLLKEIPDAYRSDRRDEKTNFMLVTGPGTAYAGRAGLTDRACPDGLDNTLLVVEVADHLAKPWTQPDDYVFNRETVQRDLFSLRKDCCFVVVGGKQGARRMPANIPDNHLLALLSPAGREPFLAKNTTSYPYPDIENELIAELERNPPARFAPPPTAKDAPEKKGTSESVAGKASADKAGTDEPPPPPDPRLPVPDEPKLATATAIAKELHKFDAAKKPAEKRALAKRLLDLGNQVTADPAGMYVLLGVARDLGAQGGDVETALAAVDKLGQTFRVDPLPMKLKALEQAAPSLESLAEAGVLYLKSLELAHELVSHDEFDGAKRSLVLAMNAARRSGNREVVAQVTTLRERLDELKVAFDRVNPALHILLRSPNDPLANAAAGKYVCLVKQDWARGLRLLARGDDEKLRELALADLGSLDSAEKQAALGDRWWEWSEKPASQLSSLERRGARLRAAHWYKQALPALPASLSSERVKQRIADANKDELPKQAGSPGKTRSK